MKKKAKLNRILMVGDVPQTLRKETLRALGYSGKHGDRQVMLLEDEYRSRFSPTCGEKELATEIARKLVKPASEIAEAGQLPLLRNVDVIIYDAAMPGFGTQYGLRPGLIRHEIHRLQREYGWPIAKVYAVAPGYCQRRW